MKKFKAWLLRKLELKGFPRDPVFYFWHSIHLFARAMLRREEQRLRRKKRKP